MHNFRFACEQPEAVKDVLADAIESLQDVRRYPSGQHGTLRNLLSIRVTFGDSGCFCDTRSCEASEP